MGSTATSRESAYLLDALFGAAALTVITVGAVGRRIQSVTQPVADAVLQPSVLPPRMRPATWLSAVARRGAIYRTELVTELDHVLDRLAPAFVSEAMRHVNVTELVQQHVDLVTIAQDLIAEIDLPEIIRDSTRAVASDTLLGVRMQSISGDDAIGRAVDRLRLRRTPRVAAPDSIRPAVVPGQPTAPTSADPGTPAGKV